MIRFLLLFTLLRRAADPRLNPRCGAWVRTLTLLALAGLLGACSRNEAETAPDRVVVKDSALPVAVDPGLVGRHPELVRYGLGETFVEVLEYRVYFQSVRKDDDVVYKAFASYERALEFARGRTGADHPLALVRQRVEAKPGEPLSQEKERVVEWSIESLRAAVARASRPVDQGLTVPGAPDKLEATHRFRNGLPPSNRRARPGSADLRPPRSPR